MSKLTRDLFFEAAARFEQAEAKVRPLWKKACDCPAVGERLECGDCPYYKSLGRLTQKKLHPTPEKVFAVIGPLVPVDPQSDQVKQLCQKMYQHGYSLDEIQQLVGVKNRLHLRSWLRDVGWLEREAQYSEQLKHKCLQMYADRCTPSQIENETNVPADLVTEWAIKAGISRKCKYSAKTKQDCLALYSEGKSSFEIHQLTGIPLDTIRKWLRIAGITRAQKRYSKKEKHKCLALYKQGKSPREIEELTGIPQATFRSWVRQNGWTRESLLLEAGVEPNGLGKVADLPRKRKPAFHWKDFELVKQEILALNVERGEIGVMPTAAELRQLGRYDLVVAISKYHGGYRAVADQLGLTYRGQRYGYWYDFSNVEANLRVFIEQRGTPGVMPSRQQLEQAGETALANALGRYGGVLGVARRLGLRLPYGKKPRGYWRNFDNLKAELLAVAEQLGIPGVMPNREELIQLQRTDLIGAIASNGGWPSVARRCGLTRRR